MKDYSSYKTTFIAIGIPLLVIGVVISIIGFTSFTSQGFNSAGLNALLFMVGAFMAFIGIALLRLSIIRPVSKYYATELSPAIKTASKSFGEGLKESGYKNSSEVKEVIKIKCPHCGYLESEDADYCSKCGKKI